MKPDGFINMECFLNTLMIYYFLNLEFQYTASNSQPLIRISFCWYLVSTLRRLYFLQILQGLSSTQHYQWSSVFIVSWFLVAFHAARHCLSTWNPLPLALSVHLPAASFFSPSVLFLFLHHNPFLNLEARSLSTLLILTLHSPLGASEDHFSLTESMTIYILIIPGNMTCANDF